jgi:ribosomal protein S18 acetylase RimI-like enzyme
MQERFQPSVFFLARSREKLVGWLCIETNSSKMAQMWRWQPFIDPESCENEIASMLIEQAIEHVKKKGQTSLETCFDGLPEQTGPTYRKYQAWYEKYGMKKVDESAYLVCNLSEHEIKDIEFPVGYEIELLSESNEEELNNCYEEAFTASEVRYFLDLTKEQRREDFKQYFNRSEPLNEASSVLVKKQQILGFTVVRTRTTEGYLSKIGIHPDFRGRKLGKLLLLSTMNKIIEQGLETMTTDVDVINQTAYRLYSNVGFKKINHFITHAWRDR